MTGRPAIERELNRALVVAERKAEDRYGDSPPGMRATAAQLRRQAGDMTDRNDRDTMLRLAAGYEERAAAALRRMREPGLRAR